MHLGLFEGIAAALVLAAIIGTIFTKLKQPLIVAFIIVGIIAGPLALNLLPDRETIVVLSEIGIAILLFGVGLKMDINEIKSSGAASTAVGIGKMIVIFAVGFGIVMLFGKPVLDAVYIGLGIVFSSTIIVVKLLADRHETESLFGRIAVGALIIEDIAVIATMVIISSLGASQQAGDNSELIKMAVGGVIAIAGVVALGIWVFPRIIPKIAQAGTEVFVLFTVAWAVGIAAIFYWLGFGMEIGAFIAGVSLASSPLRDEMSTQLYTLRDFLLVFFFINLGMGLDLASAVNQLPIAILLSIIVLVGVPIIVTVIMARMGYRRITGFSTGVALGQISEFSLILAGLGVTVGHISADTLGVITMVALLSIVGSTYSMRYAPTLYRIFERPLKLIPLKEDTPHEDSDDEGLLPADYIVFGLGRYGKKIAKGLEISKYRVLGVDFDTSAIRKKPTEYMHYTYGDIEDPNLPKHLPLTTAQWAVSTTPFVDTNIELMQSLRAAGYEGKFAATVHHSDDIGRLEKAGVDLVLTPFFDAAEQAIDLLRGVEQREFVFTDDDS